MTKVDTINQDLLHYGSEHGLFGTESTASISTGCVYSGVKNVCELKWNPSGSTDVHQWNCGHKIFVSCLIEYSLYSYKHPSNYYRELREEEISELKAMLTNICSNCPACQAMTEYQGSIPEELFNYIRISATTGTIVAKPTISKDIVNSGNAVLSLIKKPFVIDTEGYRGLSIYVVGGPNLVDKVQTYEYYPMWDLENHLFTPDIIKEGNELATGCDGIKVNGEQFFFTDEVWDWKELVSNSLDSSNQLTVQAKDFSENLLKNLDANNHPAILKVVCCDDRTLVADYKNRKLTIEQGETSYEFVSY